MLYHHHGDVRLPVYATLALCAGPVFFYRAFRDFRTRQLLQNTPASHIRSMAMGLVEVNGEVVPRSTHTAPFSGRSCAYWEIDIATQAKRSWNIVHRNSSGSPFFVKDETGLALVYPKGAECKVLNGVEEICNGINVPDCYNHYMDDEQLGFRLVWRLSRLRFRERILEEGQRVFVMGTAMPRPQSLDVSQDAMLEATGTDGPHEQRIRELQSQASATIRRGQNEPIFLISQQSERDLALTLGLRAYAGMFGGPALTLFGMSYWLLWLASLGRLSL